MIPVLESRPNYVIYGAAGGDSSGAGCRIAVGSGRPNIETFGSVAATGKRPASGHGPPGLRDYPAGPEYGPISAESGLLRSSRLCGRAF